MNIPSSAAAAVVLLYTLSFVASLLQAILREGRFLPWGLRAFGIAFLLHTATVGTVLLGHGAPFFTGPHDLYAVSSVGLAAIFLLLRKREVFQSANLLFAPAVVILYLVGVASSREYPAGLIGNPWSLVHIVLMSVAFGSFAASFFIGILFLFQERRIKNHQPGSLLSRLPPLEVMDTIHTKALTVGFILLSLAILAGALLSKQVRGLFFTGDPRQTVALVAWAIYALFLNVRIRAGWRGRRGILLSLIGFASVILAFMGLEHRGS